MTARAKNAAAKIIFVTGTDTGVGKTLLASLLLVHLRKAGCHALAMKPFCSGGREDVRFLGALQDGELQAEEICPFHFTEPVAPLVAGRMHRRRIRLTEVLDRIRKLTLRCERLIVEGSGGLFVPLGEGYTVADLIGRLHCSVVVVARNRLGTLNHTLLTARALRAMGVSRLQVAVMNGTRSDLSSRSNIRVLRRLLTPAKVFCIPSFGADASRPEAVKRNYKKVKKTLAQLAEAGNLWPVPSNIEEPTGQRKAC
jgi:dethiobiotin synthetase